MRSRSTKTILGLPPDETFWVPDDVLAYYREIGRRAAPERGPAWEQRRAAGRRSRVRRGRLAGRGLPAWESNLPVWKPDDKPVATRRALNRLPQRHRWPTIPGLMAGGADLTENTGTELADTSAAVA